MRWRLLFHIWIWMTKESRGNHTSNQHRISLQHFLTLSRFDMKKEMIKIVNNKSKGEARNQSDDRLLSIGDRIQCVAKNIKRKDRDHKNKTWNSVSEYVVLVEIHLKESTASPFSG